MNSEATRILAIDGGSQTSSLALSWSNGTCRLRSFAVGDSSTRLLTDLDSLLAEAGGALGQVNRLAGVRGPGSFTGLRVGLAVLLGLHQSLGVPATAFTTFEVLAWQARRRSGEKAPLGGPITAAVDALRNEWFVQSFDGGSLAATGEASIVTAEELLTTHQGLVIGFGLEALSGGPEFIEAEALAPDVCAMARRDGCEWNAELLTQPLYLRPPAAAVAS